ncbi:MAG: nicotinate (nicotinamide) nucleotide adenylyltransferase [Firmicutes bacterium]|nr:nicotinate (nicotinamide) nucleotide adenylyltransferase [Bacillota bacterium]
MNIALFGGTFSPPHNGHISAVKALIREFSPDLCLIVPAYSTPPKVREDGIDPSLRLQMAKIAFSDIPNVIVSDIEICRGGTSYTYDTINEIKKCYKTCENIILLCGEDMFRSLPHWYHGTDILKTATVIYSLRRGGDAAELTSLATEYADLYGADCRMLETDAIDISSSEIRAAFRRGDDISPYVPPRICEFIEKEKLYRDA